MIIVIVIGLLMAGIALARRSAPPRCPETFDAAFARRLVAYLGGDPRLVRGFWYWEEISRNEGILTRILEYFKTAQEGDPAPALDPDRAREIVTQRCWDPDPIQDDWTWRDLVMCYIGDCGERSRPKCPQHFTADFFRQLVAYLGGDPSPIQDDWSWAGFAAEYGEDDALIEGALEFFKTAQEGNPASAIHHLAVDCGLAPESALAALKEVEVGDPAEAIYGITVDCDLDVGVALAALKEVKVGAPALAIYSLARFLGLDKNRAIETLRDLPGGEEYIEKLR